MVISDTRSNGAYVRDMGGEIEFADGSMLDCDGQWNHELEKNDRNMWELKPFVISVNF